MAHLSQTLCEELKRTLRSKEWDRSGDELILASQGSDWRNNIILGSGLNTGFFYNSEFTKWSREAVALFMDLVRLTCAGRTINIDPTGEPQTDKHNEVFLKPDDAICLLLKQRARQLTCEALSAVDVLGILVMDD